MTRSRRITDDQRARAVANTRASGVGHMIRVLLACLAVLKDAEGNQVILWGQTGSSSTTPGHDTTMEAMAHQMADSGDCEYITIQRSWRTATGRVSKSRRIPDIIGVRRDGKVDAFEVRSRTDKENVLEQRLKEGLKTLPVKHQGQTRVFQPKQ